MTFLLRQVAWLMFAFAGVLTSLSPSASTAAPRPAVAATAAAVEAKTEADARSTPEPALVADFALPRWNTGATVRLADYAGEIVVLDFFAYWCGPCKRASMDIEDGLQRHYAARHGNVHGVPVRVFAVNIEQDHPARTTEFIRQTGLASEQVLNDLDGGLLERFGGAGTPFVVVLDGTRARPESPGFRLAYQHAGFEGIRTLRTIIDAIPHANPATAAAARADRADPAGSRMVIGAEEGGKGGEGGAGAPREQQAEVAFDAVESADIGIETFGTSYRWKQGGTDVRLGYVHNHYAVDYRPFRSFDFLGFSEQLDESLNGLQAGVKQRAGDRLTFNAGGSVYEGFTDYRSLWLANYYQQQFSFVPGYEQPHPRGFGASGGARWEYQPTTGFLEASFRYGNDEIAPGYELDQGTGELQRGRRLLHTYAPAVKFETVLTARLRTQHEFELRLTSGREQRYLYRGSLNAALGERWTWRTSGGYTHENPTLRAWFAGTTLEFDLTRHWHVNLFGLYYRDTGEIENSLFISTAAPGVRTYQAGAGLRYTGERSTVSLSVAPLRTEYEPVEVGTRPFTNLYRDRTWIYVQAAWNFEF